MIKVLLTSFSILFTSFLIGQSNPFHTLNFPGSSPTVVEMQRLGITEISISYHSPALRGRDVWNDADVIPNNGDPIPWRAGANMNTTISFSTDVKINDQPLKAGTYGFHVIPKGDTYTLLFAHNSNLWGSYYLDLDDDISLRVDVKAETCEKTEQLDYEFFNRDDNTVTIGLEWDTLRLPFKVSVDLNETVLTSFRNELRGVNTYRWEAWNDAANWCLRQNVNLEEALSWVDRSIDGGYNGFGGNKNLTNLATKARILEKLDRNEEYTKTLDEAMNIYGGAYDYNNFIVYLLGSKSYTRALAMSTRALTLYPDVWYLKLNKAVCQYHAKKKSKQTFKLLDQAEADAPESYRARIQEIREEMRNNTYVLRG